MQMRFTKSEIDLVMHRLEMPDCIAECFADGEHEGCRGEWTEADVEAACESLARRLVSGDFANLTDCERDVLEDAIDGSTWCATHFGNGLSTQRENAAVRTAMSAARKASKILGKRLEAPVD